MIKIFLLLAMMFSFAFSAIDERKTDVYFANGILTKQQTAIDNALLLKDEIKQKFGIDYYNNKIGKVDYTYNSTHDMFREKDGLFDLLESVFQKIEWQETLDWLLDTAHERDLDDQIKTYKTSIKDSHTVLVVAHSQGNLFTREAYAGLADWMKPYFEAISIASPMTADIKENTPRIDWDNDLVARIANLGASDVDDVNSTARKISWFNTDKDPFNSDDNIKPNSPPDIDNYTIVESIGKLFENIFKAYEGGINSDVHAFTFYMGQALKNGDNDQIIHDPFTGNELIDESASKLILKAIENKIKYLDTVKSQWKIKQTAGCGCNKKVSLTHIEPTANLDHTVEDVNPLTFDETGKLYQVYDETNTTLHWVKGSAQGTAIKNEQTHLPNVCYSLSGTEEIIKGSDNPEPHDRPLFLLIINSGINS